MKPLASIDLSQLSRVAGGQSANTDLTEHRLSVPKVGPYRVPVDSDKTKSTRTPFGKCIDDGNASCDKQGGTNQAVGTCMLNNIDACSKRHGL